MKTLAILSLFLCLALPAYAEDAGQSGSVPSEPVQKKISQWRQLKTENPQAFQRLVDERKKNIHQKASEFRKDHPEKFEALKKNVMQGRRERLSRLRDQNPQEFQRVMGGRMQKFRDWKTEHPEKFQQFAQNHPRVAEKFQRQSQKNQSSRPGYSRPRDDMRERGVPNRRPDFQERQGPEGFQQRGSGDPGSGRRDFREAGRRRRNE